MRAGNSPGDDACRGGADGSDRAEATRSLVHAGAGGGLPGRAGRGSGRPGGDGARADRQRPRSGVWRRPGAGRRQDLRSARTWSGSRPTSRPRLSPAAPPPGPGSSWATAGVGIPVASSTSSSATRPTWGSWPEPRRRGGRSALGGGPYADVAAEFLLRALALARPDGGRVALVLPQSILASRDTAPIRVAVLERGALVGLWWAGEQAFEDAQVSVCVVVVQRGVRQGGVSRWRGTGFRPLPAAPARAVAGPTWSPLIADVAGVPVVDLDPAAGRLADLAGATAGFRHQYYGLIEHVRDVGPGPPLVTAGLIDVGCLPLGLAGRPASPNAPSRPPGSTSTRSVPRTLPSLRWVEARLRPKVLVATQTRVIEAVADPEGAWVPSVPVVAVHPRAGRRPVDGRRGAHGPSRRRVGRHPAPRRRPRAHRPQAQRGRGARAPAPAPRLHHRGRPPAGGRRARVCGGDVRRLRGDRR